MTMRKPHSVGEWVELILGRAAIDDQPGMVGILHSNGYTRKA